MFNKYIDLILSIVVIVQLIEIYLTITLSRKNNSLEKINKALRGDNLVFNKGNSMARATTSKVLNIVQLNANDINQLKLQMEQVHTLLGQVLNVSNLIPSEGKTDTASRIEELRQLVKFSEELAKHKIDETNYYKGK